MRGLRAGLVSLVVLSCACEPAETISGSPQVAQGELAQSITNATTDGNNPAVVYLTMSSGGRVVIDCTGTLVARRGVLTSRHCIRTARSYGNVPANTTFAPGDVRVGFADSTGAPQSYVTVTGVELHPTANLALLETSQATQVTPIPIGNRALEGLVGQPLRVVGFGVTGEGRNDSGRKRTGLSTLIATDALQVLGAQASANMTEIGRVVFSANRSGPGSNQCAGDSGGPVLMNYAGTETLVGVFAAYLSPAAAGQMGACDLPDTLNAQVRVNAYYDWINTNVQNRRLDTGDTGGDDRQSAAGCNAPASGSSPWSIAAGAVALCLALSRRRRRRRSPPT